MKENLLLYISQQDNAKQALKNVEAMISTNAIDIIVIDALPEAKDLIDKGFMTGTVVQDPRTLADMFYTIGMNLAQNFNSIENTNYKIGNGEIIIPYNYQAYTSKANDS